jgi:hypothetical protein
MTDDLIARLSADVTPVRPGFVLRRLGLGVGMGVAVSAGLMLVWLGVRPDLGAAAAAMPYWMKFGYTSALALCGFWLAERAGRPGMRLGGLLALAVVPVLIMGLMGSVRMGAAPPALRPHLFWGASSHFCVWRISVLSAPILVGGIWAMRGLAPTRPTLAGAVSGLLAGGAGAWVYAFHCDESAAPFVAFWYTLGIVIVACVGALSGRWILRW